VAKAIAWRQASCFVGQAPIKTRREPKVNKRQSSKEWYKHGWGLVADILLLPFFVIWYAWARSNWSKNSKIAATTATVVLIGVGLAVGGKQPSKDQATTTASQNTQTTSKEQPKQASQQQPQSPDPQAKAQADKITVESVIVKKVSGKYRYFFDVGNGSDKPFNGSITVSMVSAGTGIKLPVTLDLTTPIQSDLHQSRYVDLHSQIEKFSYKIKIGNDTFEGYPEKPISSNYEDTDL